MPPGFVGERFEVSRSLETSMPPDPWSLYALMLKSRLFEEAVATLWDEGLISGEMHLGTGEEAIIAGVVSHLREGDSLALDHRGTAAMLMRGVDPVLILREMLGHPDGLNGGYGGHMHLFSKEHLAASSGIAGSAGPMAAGFGLAAQHLGHGAVAVAFFGEGAMNQGMLMEAINLAVVWKLPVLFVCKDDGWTITVQSKQMTGGDLNERARGLGITAVDVDGRDVSAVWEAARQAIEYARAGAGPTFLHASCVHFEAHFLGFQLTRALREPLKEVGGSIGPLTRSMLRGRGADLAERARGLQRVLEALRTTVNDPRRDPKNDPVLRERARLQSEAQRLEDLERQVQWQIGRVLESALAGMPS